MSDGTPSANRLAGENSPYLLLHRHNPVDWHPWGEVALARARAEDKPIFLSVGYSTCYWCHVMERESFSDLAIAGLMNREFVSIKVDREERPDLDEVYMVATQLLTGQGGWPNSVFLTPDLKPFFAGTYFPPADRHGHAGFPTVLNSLAEAWRTRRAEVLEQAEAVAEAMHQALDERGRPVPELPGPGAAEASLASLARRYDPAWGGFGGAPKFPTPSNLLLLLEFAGEREDAARMLAGTLEAMGRGGIYDQIGGGFHRYATDREWRVPHFEKMLYDNGLLLEVYARDWARTGDPERARIVRGIASFLAAEMTSPEGAFWSAIDAETGGREGAFYVWTRPELREALGEEDFGFLAPLLGFDGPPFFEAEHYVLHLPRLLVEQAERRRISYEALLAQVEPALGMLRESRERRRRPATDDKVLADWNGLAIGGLAVAGRLLGEPALVARAATAAEFVLAELRPGGGLLHHAWRAGRAAVPAFLPDYAFLVRGLLALEEATGAGSWLETAAALAEEQERRLADPRGGFFTAAEARDILVRSREVFDGALPAGNAIGALNALELARRTGDDRWLRCAKGVVRAFGWLVEQQPDAARMLTLAARGLEALEGKSRAAPTAAADLGAPALEDEARGKVRVSVTLSRPEEGGWSALACRFAVADGWHLGALPGQPEGSGPLEVRAAGCELEGLTVSAEKPAGVRGDGPDAMPAVLRLAGRVRAADDGGPARLMVYFQLCDDRRCLPPTTVEIPLSLSDGVT